MPSSLVLLTDFGHRDRFVASMKGVAVSIDPGVRIFDLTHEIEPFDILEAAVTLVDTIPYWPRDTVFVAVVDPGVGTERRSLAVKTLSGHCVICPDNGLVTFVDEWQGIEEAAAIDEETHRLPGSEAYHTFHGRDIFIYNGAKLAGHQLSIRDLGESVSVKSLQRLRWHPPLVHARSITGTVLKSEKPFGNLVTDIPKALLEQCEVLPKAKVKVKIFRRNYLLYEDILEMATSFGAVPRESCLAYLDSNGRLGFAMNGGNMAAKYHIQAGLNCKVEIAIK